MIEVTIKLSWDVKKVNKPLPCPFTTQVAPGTTLSKILKLAALSDKEGPYNRYSTTFFAGLGDMVIALDGVWQDKEAKMYWMIYDEASGELTPVGMDDYLPSDGSTTVFKYEKVGGPCDGA